VKDTPLLRKGVNKVALRLFEHNEKAYHAAVWMMEQYGKAAIVHPTGTGKSYIAFKLIEDNPEKVVIWLSPSEYIFKTQLESLKRNDPDFSLANVHFYTYAKLMCCTEGQLAEIAGLQPSYIILDEFHRAGAECWGESTVALLKLCPEAKLLGLTATNVRYLDNNRDMAEELFDSRVASDMTLGEAIVRGILPAPNYVTTVYQYQKTLAKYQARVDNLRTPGIQDANQKYLDALRRALEQADGLDRVFAHHITNKCGKYIVFCASKEHMDEMVPHVPEWFAGVNPDVVVYQAYSDDPNTDKAFSDFKTDTSNRLKLLFCIDMLNESVHVEGISGVILFRPTISPIIYKQQIGRALTAGDNTTPIILDVVNNFEGLASISGLQSEMQEAVHRLYANGEGDKIVTEWFEVVEQVHDCRVLFEQLQASLSSSWEHYFSEASIYYAEHGNLNVPKLYTTPSGLSLGVWLVTQRRVREGQTQGNLTEQQIARLDSIGMVWGNRDDRQWNEGYQKARRYFDAHGDLNVPVGYVSPDGYNLGNWVKRQRYTRHNPEKSCAVLTEERIARLDTIGCGGKKRTRERSGWSWHKSLRGKAKIWMSQLTINGRRHRFV
jgi:superfamily II DNA or RNA helicase